jgi:hypothetical protein
MIKDYNLEVHYHPGKANVVVDALSQKSHVFDEEPLPLSLCGVSTDCSSLGVTRANYC